MDAFVKEEVYYREVNRLGLDRSDTIVRRRMMQKLEFLTEPDDAALKHTDGDLNALLAANRGQYRLAATDWLHAGFF